MDAVPGEVHELGEAALVAEFYARLLVHMDAGGHKGPPERKPYGVTG